MTRDAHHRADALRAGDVRGRGLVGVRPTARSWPTARHRHYLVAVDDDGALLGWAGLRSLADEAEILTVGVIPTARRRGIGTRAAGRPARRGPPARRRRGVPRRAGRQRRRAAHLRARGLRRRRAPPRLLRQRPDRLADDVAGAGSMPSDLTNRWCSASRRRATRPASASCAARRCSPTRSRAASRSTPASAASCPRSPAARTSRRWCRRCSARSTTAGVRPSDIDAIAVTAGPGLAGALLVGVAAAKAYALALGKPLYGVNHLSVARRGRPARERPAGRAVRGVAGLGRALVGAAGAAGRRRGDHRARRDRRRRGRRGVRQGGPAARAAVPGRPADRPGWPARAIRPRSPSRAG